MMVEREVEINSSGTIVESSPQPEPLADTIERLRANVPPEMQKSHRWVCWRWEYRGGAKPTKTPYQVQAGMGGAEESWPRASATEPATWGTFEQALASLTHHDGVGFMLGDGWAGVDLDECIDPRTGVEEEWAIDTVYALDSYTEISPSQTGLKAIVYAKGVKLGRRKGAKQKVEIYSTGRFFTVTGRHFPGTSESVEDRQEEVEVLLARHAGDRASSANSAINTPKDYEAAVAAVEVPVEEREAQARRYLAAVPGTREGDGADSSCCRIAMLVLKGFALPVESAVEVLTEWGQKDTQLDHRGHHFPWTEKEIRRKVKWAIKELYSGRVGDKLGRHDPMPDVDQAVGGEWPDLAPAPTGVPGVVPTASRPTTNFRFLTVEELLAMEPPSWLIDQHVMEGSFGVVYGDSGAGKTFLALDLALSVATGKPYQGLYAVQQGEVVYLIGEGQGRFGTRISAWQKYHGTEASGFYVLPSGLDCLEEENRVKLFQDVKALCSRPALIVIDTLARHFGAGEENSAKDMGKFVSTVDLLRQTGAAVLVVHHSGKDGNKRERGSTALRGAADAVILVGNKQDGTKRFTEVCCDKQKDAEPFTHYSLGQEIVPLGKDGQGKDITSLVLTQADRRTGRLIGLKEPVRDFLRDLKEAFVATPFTGDEAISAGKLPRSTTFRYLKEMKEARIVEQTRRGGKWIINQDFLQLI